MTLRVVADENIPFVTEAFSGFGPVRALSAKAITPEVVREAEILLVRSVTKVNDALLCDSPVRFVATATIGVDHIDQPYLASRDIDFASAPGSNATSVAEWVTAAMLHLARARNIRLSDMTLGIVGVGNVGSRGESKARALGMRVLLNDPPRARAEGEDGFVELDALLAEADFITLHVPLNDDGPDATRHLADATFFKRMKPTAILLNSSRGDVVDEAALLGALTSGEIATAALDVWHAEPGIDVTTLSHAALATPHIAGYSFDGKVAGTRMIHEAACAALGMGEPWDPTPLLPPPEVPDIGITCRGRDEEEVFDAIVRQVYPLASDDRRLRKIAAMTENEIGPHFTHLRKTYPRRREFPHTRVRLAGASESLRNKVQQLGFQLA